ncbi:hypothetical protein [Arhodomonas sp. AD133]|uniref:hypothetical protein n=1 Tax=Arhodomonas sp. AD133 TaxID=3415009 RepID=UPI003EB7C5AF
MRRRAPRCGGVARCPALTSHWEGFVSLGLFGLALSLPLVAAVMWAPMRRVLDRLAGLSARAPFWAGVVLIALGLWSIGFGLFTDLENWT